MTKLNLYQKLAKARSMVQDSGMKKSGKNKFVGYEYFELGDFLPEVNKANNEIGLLSVFKETNHHYVLLVFDSEDMKQKPVTFICRKATATLKGVHDVQNLGAVITYSRRYLYMQAYEIAESDALDAGSGPDKSPKKQPTKPAPTKPDKKTNPMKLVKNDKPEPEKTEPAPAAKTGEPVVLNWEIFDPWAVEIGMSKGALSVYHKKHTPEEAYTKVKTRFDNEPESMPKYKPAPGKV